jgi:ABC-type dipeptide/oligopeptide/nickel transport system permease subunit
MAGTAVAFAIGAGLGLAALALGRWAEGVTFALIDVVRALPSTLLALLLIVGLGTGSIPLTIALGISFAPLVAYVSRAAYHREAAREYVLAARTFGVAPSTSSDATFFRTFPARSSRKPRSSSRDASSRSRC